MGNERTLKMIAAAASKLKRIDPDYIRKTHANSRRIAQERSRKDRITSSVQYAAFYNLYVVNNNEADIEETVDISGTASLAESMTYGNKVFEFVKDQNHNRAIFRRKQTGRTAVLHEYDGHKLTIAEWSQRSGIPAPTIATRLRSGYSIADAVTRPSDGSDRRPIVRVLIPSSIKRRASNKRVYEYDGVRHTVQQWADIYGLNEHTVATRLRRGWSVDRALNVKTRLRCDNATILRGWVETSSNNSTEDRPPSLEIFPKQTFFPKAII